MSTKAQVLKVPRSDATDDAFVLVHVTPDGPSLLDVKLTATEGESPFTGIVRQNRLHKLRAKNYDSNGDEWEAIVSRALHRESSKTNAGQLFEGLEVVSSINDEQLIITLRKNIGGITVAHGLTAYFDLCSLADVTRSQQRLGTISLTQDNEQAIELFDWTGVASTAAASAENDLASLTVRYHDQEITITKLKKQLEDLIKAKQEHENSLLEKFRELLNTKKRKIRDQQRLLADAKVNPKAAAQVQEARGSSGSRKVEQSRQGKRKANGAAIDEDEESDDDGFEDMNVDGQGFKGVRDQMGREETPDKSDLDESEDEAEEDHPVPAGVGAKGRAIETVKQKEPTTKSQESSSPPPRRELPFANQNQEQTPPKKTPLIRDMEGESDEETDDDEL
ncbi:MAG: hypothetical protein M1812_001862 [Candelaria pacifica]|nr:MAG: hypothetical protein M1812_001862 [Candelaria pacifica]